MTFTPARDKLEAVVRLGTGAGRPGQELGPGSKERKSTLVNVASGLAIDIDGRLSKPAYAGELARVLGETWDRRCWSAGRTVTLRGLNQILRGAERHARWSTGVFTDPAADEAASILNTVARVVSPHWDGRAAVTSMRQARSSQWRQVEWPGFYFEHVAIPACVGALRGGPVTFANTRFDYARTHVWDLKVHSSKSGRAPLNDADAMRECLASGRGLGFVVLHAERVMDNGSFRAWHKRLGLKDGRRARESRVTPRFVRRSKASVRPSRLEVFFLADLSHLESALRAGAIKVMRQGRQATGQPRKTKYVLNFRVARDTGLVLAEREVR